MVFNDRPYNLNPNLNKKGLIEKHSFICYRFSTVFYSVAHLVFISMIAGLSLLSGLRNGLGQGVLTGFVTHLRLRIIDMDGVIYEWCIMV